MAFNSGVGEGVRISLTIYKGMVFTAKADVRREFRHLRLYSNAIMRMSLGKPKQ